MLEVVKMLEDLTTTNITTKAVSHGERNKLVFFEDANPTFDLEDLLRGSAKVLGMGTYGGCYFASLENGNRVVVKRLKDVALKEFQQHIEVLGRMGHENVAKLRAYYFNFSIDEMLLVYDHYDQGSVSSMLHGELGTHLEWGDRLEIAVGAARGIAHIHSHLIVHGNVKSSNIFVNGQTYGIISEAGLIKLMGPNKARELSRGYRAPGIKDTGNVYQASDVYSFGVVLLELLCGRPSPTTAYGVEMKLVKWVKLQARAADKLGIFDVRCVRNETEEAMKRMFEIAMDCVSQVKHRPTISRVVQVLEEIRGIKSERLSFDTKLGNVLEDLLPMLTIN
ncbi:hypothetical protein ACS0TY_015713 [Phlomoides rotata]